MVRKTPAEWYVTGLQNNVVPRMSHATLSRNDGIPHGGAHAATSQRRQARPAASQGNHNMETT